ncbi:MAG TPA: sulfite oxidase, partial [Bryobacteraceae bacterium]|nr:sulfite oxidase [Bryobacteraceae bacterium]
MPSTRRTLLKAGLAAAVSPYLAPGAGSSAQLITLSPSPSDLEMPVEGFIDEITPTEHFFVRCHTMTPKVDAATWKLEIAGLVDHPLSLTLADLKKFPRVELTGVLECAGNGRSFYNPRIPGAQWRFGSVGNARWAGVRLRDVMEKAGVKAGGGHLLLDGADVPLGKMPDFQRSLPLAKAMDPDTLLAWEMNGKPLTAAHGFPLRVIASGWAGDSWVKWLQRIEVLDHEFDGFWMKTAYRHPNKHVAPGAVVDAADLIPVTDLNVKSVIARPGEWAKPGLVNVVGVAWSNASPVTKVDVSADGGKTWNEAKLPGTGTKYGFRRFSYQWKAAEGKHVLMSRATNAAGQSQPMEPEWNPSGYLYNAAQPREIAIASSAPAAAPVATEASGMAPAGYKESCFTCHDESMMKQQRLTRAQWDREITK